MLAIEDGISLLSYQDVASRQFSYITHLNVQRS